MTVTKDPTSGKYRPASAAEWTELLAGSGIANPSILLLCQESTGPLADSISTFTFAATDSPLYQQAVPGWASVGVALTEGSTARFTNSDSGLPDLSTTSCMAFAWVTFPAPTGGYSHESVLTLGPGASYVAAQVADDSPYYLEAQSDAVIVTGSTSELLFDGNVHPLIVQYDHTNAVVNIQTDLETISPPIGTPSGQKIWLGGDNGVDLWRSGGQTFIYVAVWFGAAAELDAGHRATLLTRLESGPPSPPPAPTIPIGPSGVAYHWGPHFPDAAQPGVKHWSIHFPDGGQNPATLAGFGPAGSGTLMLDLGVGFKVTYEWVTDIIPRRDGSEQRPSINDAPKQLYSGNALLDGNSPRSIRAQLARFAANGSPLLLGLAHEAITFDAPASGDSVFVSAPAQALCDWMNPGQRVMLEANGVFLAAVIQQVGSGAIVLDVAPGATGNISGQIMPAMPVLLDPQQSFARYQSIAEKWQMQARAAIFDFAPVLADLALSTVTSSGKFAGAFVRARPFGLQGNAISFSLAAGGSGVGSLADNGGAIVFTYAADTTTIGDLAAALGMSSYGQLVGTWNPTDTIPSGDAFASTLLSGATTAAAVGTGASVTTFDGVTVWDRGLELNDTAMDSVNSMTEIIDLDGIPYAIGTADFPDWGRAVMLTSDLRSEWQWFKLFMATVRGRQSTFWLPTWRPDFTFVSKGTSTILISTTDGSDFFAWYPAQRSYVQIEQVDGTITYAGITAAVDNNDGTITLTIVDGSDSPLTISGTGVESIGWLELCRFESDSFDVTFSGSSFSVATIARAVRA